MNLLKLALILINIFLIRNFTKCQNSIYSTLFNTTVVNGTIFQINFLNSYQTANKFKCIAKCTQDMLCNSVIYTLPDNKIPNCVLFKNNVNTALTTIRGFNFYVKKSNCRFN